MVSLASFNAQSTGDLVFSEKNARLCTLPVSLAAQENSNSVISQLFDLAGFLIIIF